MQDRYCEFEYKVAFPHYNSPDEDGYISWFFFRSVVIVNAPDTQWPRRIWFNFRGRIGID